MYFMGEQSMNVLMLLKNKSEVAFVYDTNTLRQGIEKMHAHGYSAIPVLSKDGTYVGSVSEGDFLWHILEYRNNDYGYRKIIRSATFCARTLTLPLKSMFPWMSY